MHFCGNIWHDLLTNIPIVAAAIVSPVLGWLGIRRSMTKGKCKHD